MVVGDCVVVVGDCVVVVGACVVVVSAHAYLFLDVLLLQKVQL